MMLTREQIIATIEAEEAACLESVDGDLQNERADALERYRGEKYGNEVDGRSQVVDRSIADTIEWIMPSLVRVYMGGEDIGTFRARGPEDEEPAKIETDVCNYYLQAKNDFFSTINAVLRDALLLKNGYAVASWRTDDAVTTERYTGLSDEEAAMLMQDADVEVVEHSQYPDPLAPTAQQMSPAPPSGAAAGGSTAPMLHDLKVERKKADEYVAVDAIPPDEMRISHRHRNTSLLDCAFVQWIRRDTIGQFRTEGFDIADDEPGDDAFESSEASSRARYSFEINPDESMSDDPTMRRITLKDTYIKADFRGTGLPQLWRVVMTDTGKNILLQEEADIIPFAAFSPIIYAHSHIGTSVYDLISDLAEVKTVLMRQYLDGVYQANNGEKAIDQDRVNLDDLLVTRPGRVVRVTGDPGTAIFPMVTPDVTGTVLQGLQYVDATKEQRTGVRAWTEGMGSQSLHPTATGVQSVDSQQAQRIELIARTLASGFRDLFCIIHALVSKHSTKPIQLKLNNKWIAIDPRSWTRRTDFDISVGLGVGTPDVQMAKLMQLAPMLQQAMGMGMAGPEEAYNLAAEILKAAGFRFPDKFIKAPQPNPQTGQFEMPPPQPSPQEKVEMVRQQGDQAKTQATLQADAQKFQAEQAAAKEKLQMEDALQQRRLAAELEVQRQNDERDAAADLLKHGREQETKLAIAQLQSATSIEVAKISRGLDEPLAQAQEQMGQVAETAETANAVSEQLAVTLATGLEQMRALMEQLAQAVQINAAVQSAPKRIVRDPMTGKAIGVEPVQTIQ